MGMRVDIVTLFPEMCQQVLDASILGRAAKRGYIETHCHQIRDYTLNKQKQTDDYPYGGGCGMVLYAQPIADCLRAVQQEVAAQGRPAPHIVFLTAGGQRYTEEHARRLAQYDNLTLVCGHYEGIDERVIDAFADEEISIGDYILTGGELASLVVADSVLRLKPGVLAEQKGYEEESYWDGLLEYPQYTRPEVWEGRAVPQVLLGGDHQKIDTWRGQQSRERTRLRRPELYEQWCETHPITQLPKWKRGENMRLVKTEEQFAAAARLFAEGRRTVCEGCWTEEALAEWTPEFFYAQLKEEKQQGWAVYLHCTKDVPDGMVAVSHKTGQVEHLFITADARGKGLGQKLLDFARKKLPEHAHPVLTVLDKNTRAIALYRRMGWKVCGVAEVFDPAKDGSVTARAELLEKMPPFLSGGDMIGAVHEHKATWAEGPRKFEAGTRNVGGEVGFAAAIDYMKGIGWEAMETHEHALLDRMLAGMRAMPWLTVYGEPVAEGRYGVVSFNVNDVHPHDVATILDAGGVAVRAGHHCAQPLMEFLGIGSCCRASVAIYNTPEDVDALLENLENVRKVMGL